VPSLQEAFSHNPGDGGGAAADLLADIIADVQLAAVLLLAVAVAEIHHQLFRQIEFGQRFAGGGDILGMVIRFLPPRIMICPYGLPLVW
jgi:hypothetical protein